MIKCVFQGRSLSLLLLLVLGMIWGTGYSIARFATLNGVSPLGYSFWQSFGPALFLTTLAYLARRPIPCSWRHCRYYLMCGLIGIALPNTNMYFAAPHLPAGLLAVIVNTVPIMTYPIALAVGQERFHWGRFLGIWCAIIGLMFIVLPKSSLPEPSMIPWVVCALLTPLCFAICAIYITQKRPPESSSLAIAAGTLIASSLLLGPWVFTSGQFYPLTLPLTLPELVVLLEIVLSSIGYVLFFILIKVAGPVYYSLTDGVVALTGLFWGMILFQERLNIWTASAVILILLAIFLVTGYARAGRSQDVKTPSVKLS